MVSCKARWKGKLMVSCERRERGIFLLILSSPLSLFCLFLDELHALRARRARPHGGGLGSRGRGTARQVRRVTTKKGVGGKVSSTFVFGLIQTQMAQRPMLRSELYARALGASQNLKRAEVWE
jgi:hypothetical protein